MTHAQQVCSMKRRYPRWRNAIEAVHRMRRKFEHYQAPYKCSLCHHWHLTTVGR